MPKPLQRLEPHKAQLIQNYFFSSFLTIVVPSAILAHHVNFSSVTGLFLRHDRKCHANNETVITGKKLDKVVRTKKKIAV